MLVATGTACVADAAEVSPNSGGGAGSSSSSTTVDSAATDSTSGDPASGGTTGTTDGDGCQTDADCDDGLFCTGPELCRPGMGGADARGCVSTADPCQAPDQCSESAATCLPPCEANPDSDGDGFDRIECGGDDCNDADEDIYPGAPEVCDDVDDDCDPTTLGGADEDQDGEIDVACCNPDPDGRAVCGTDCDDGVEGSILGSWFDCTSCGAACETQQACEAQSCAAARRVFVTSTTFAADFGGEAGADAACQEVATAAALGGTWRAFLVQSADGLNRHAQANVPYVRLDGVRVADSWADLTDQMLAAPLEVTETLAVVSDNVWTGLSDQNEPGSVDCDDWTSTAGGCLSGGPCGGGGQTYEINERWDGFFIYNCTDLYRLYCIEQ